MLLNAYEVNPTGIDVESIQYTAGTAIPLVNTEENPETSLDEIFVELLSPQTLNVLVVEDDYEDFYLIRKLLDYDDKHRYNLVNVKSVKQCQQALSASAFHVILLDLNLAETQGIETVQKVKALAGGSVPIIVMTGDGSASTGIDAITYGAEDYLPKAEANTATLSRIIQFSIHRNQLRAC